MLEEKNLLLTKVSSNSFVSKKSFQEQFSFLVSTSYQPFFINDRKQLKSVLIKAGAIVLGGMSGIPYLTASREYAGSNKVLGEVYVYSELVSLGVLTSWLFLDILQYYQINSFKKNSGCNKTIIAVGLGSLSALPSTIIGIIYNPEIPYLAVIAFTGDIISNTCAFDHFVRYSEKYLRSALNKRSRVIENFREEIINQLRLGYLEILNLEKEKILIFLKEKNLYDGIPENIKKSLNTQNLIQILTEYSKCRNFNLKNIKNKKIDIMKRIFIYSSSILFPLGWWGSTGIPLVYNNINDTVGNSMVAGIITAFTAVPVYMIEALFVKNMLSKIINIIDDLCSNNYRKNFSEKYYPTVFFSSIILGIIITAFSFATRAKIVEDNYEETEPMHELFLVWVIITVVMYKSYAMVESIPNIITYFSSISNNKDVSAIARFCLFMENFILTIEEMDFELFNSLNNSLDYEILDRECNQDSIFIKEINHDMEGHSKRMDNNDTGNPPILYNYNSGNNKNKESLLVTARAAAKQICHSSPFG